MLCSLEYWTVDRVQKLSKPECCTPSSEFFRIKTRIIYFHLRNTDGMLSPSSWKKFCMICNLLSFIQLVKSFALYLNTYGLWHTVEYVTFRIAVPICPSCLLYIYINCWNTYYEYQNFVMTNFLYTTSSEVSGMVFLFVTIQWICNFVPSGSIPPPDFTQFSFGFSQIPIRKMSNFNCC